MPAGSRPLFIEMLLLPAYRENPIAETLKAVTSFAADERFARYYADFLRQ